jgi:divalent metal cation (Fe/Co/Zn/Cd) transporter
MPLQDSRGVVDAFLPPEHLEKRARDAKHARWAINVNVVANVLLLIGKLFSLRFSPSLSLAASTADSALDLFCTLIVYGTNRVVAWRLRALQMKYPVGRRRLEPIGILVFSVIMVVSFLQILQKSVYKLLPWGDHEVAALPPVAIGAMAANAVIKGFIGLGCRHVKTTQVQALVQDCKTDVYFNIVSLLFPLIGVTANVWWLDPAGASLLALFVIVDWAETCIRNVSRLTGSNVGYALQKKLMYLAFRFSPVVEGFKALTAYHAGDGVWVELDILLDEATPLPTAHDIAETLQYCYEGLQEVDRAFVTVDYSTLGPTGHSVA